MRPGVTVAVTAVDRRRLGAIIGNRNVPQKHAWRAEIVLLTADGLGTVEIMRRTGKSKTCVWRWQERFAAEGVDGLLRDKTRDCQESCVRGHSDGDGGHLWRSRKTPWTSFWTAVTRKRFSTRTGFSTS
jgi:hypothetical protein